MTLLVGSIFHMTRKIVSEMTYNVSMGTLNPTIPYYTIAYQPSLLRLYSAILVLRFVVVKLSYIKYLALPLPLPFWSEGRRPIGADLHSSDFVTMTAL